MSTRAKGGVHKRQRTVKPQAAMHTGANRSNALAEPAPPPPPPMPPAPPGDEAPPERTGVR